MEDYSVTELPNEQLVIAVASTTGQGDAPDNMRSFWSFLLRRSLPPDSLFGTVYAVFGLGDSSYAKYNAVAKRLDRRLEQLGASRVQEIGLGDDQDGNGYDEILDPWLASLWESVLQKFPLPPGFVVDTSLSLPPARYAITKAEGTPSTPARANQTPADGKWDAARPFLAEVVQNDLLTKEGASDREVRHVEFDISGSGITYIPGDNVAIQPTNRSEDVECFAEILGLNLDLVVDIQPDPSSEEAPPRPLCGFGAVRLRALLSEHLDFMNTPRRYFFQLLPFFCPDEVQRERLEELSSVEGRDDLYSYCQKQNRSYLEIFRDFPAARPPLHYLLDLVPPLQPRYYSISSSPSASPARISVTAAVVAYKSKTTMLRFGVCTSFLKRCAVRTSAQQGARVPIWVRSGTLQLPSSKAAPGAPPAWTLSHPPLLLVGPGTGVAPLRSFMLERRHWREERRKRGAQEGSQDLLFFGCRNKAVDFLYREEWEAMAASQDLKHLGLAFSRDQEEKVYVQHRIGAAATLVWEALEDGAVVMICGSSEKMPRDVRDALAKVVEVKGGMSEEEADQYLKRLETQRRYLLDTWS